MNREFEITADVPFDQQKWCDDFKQIVPTQEEAEEIAADLEIQGYTNVHIRRQ